MPNVIGLTGPFGSGCSTAAGILRDELGYEHLRLSEIIRERWAKKHRRVPFREELQNLGNHLREDSGRPGFLVEEMLKKLDGGKARSSIVIDAIRNRGEIRALRNRFGTDFYLLAFECPTSERWKRVKKTYRLQRRDRQDFMDDDQRDRGQEYDFGQQVQLCVDRSDVMIDNGINLSKRALRGKVVEYTLLLTGEKPRYAFPQEIFMNLAYSASHSSKCLKRQVGALLVAASPGERGEIISQGFNENPIATHPCVEEPKYGANLRTGKPGSCYRDIVRHESFVQLGQQDRHCPKCGERLKRPEKKEPPWRCSKCSCDLEVFFWPERAMSLCTAVHAEAMAIISAGSRAKGTTLYTTTFPCFQCAEKIAHAGIQHIVFTEPYPDIRAFERLQLAGIRFARFEGVRSGRFDEIFERARPSFERRITATST